MLFVVRCIVPSFVTLSLSAFFVLSVAPRSAIAAGTVGDGTPASCTETAYDAAFTDGGLVTFNCGAAPVTITLSHQTTLTRSTRIDGGGLITLSGNDATSIFFVPKGVKLQLMRLAVTRTLGIDNRGKLTVSNCTFSDNNAGAISNRNGSLKVTDSIFVDNYQTYFGGSAIFQYFAKGVVTNTTFSNNANHAIQSTLSKLKLSNCTFSGNSADMESGGALYADDGVKIANSTFFGNSAQEGGAIFVHGDIAVSGSTFVNNTATASGSGAIFVVGGKVSLKGTLFADNSSGHCASAEAQFVDKGHNLIDTAGCGLSVDKGSLIGSDPMLTGGLADNGGPTQTVALDSGSPAKNAAKCTKTDQRGYVRPGNGAERCTIGAYEIDAATCPKKLSPCGSPALCTNLLKQDLNNCGACGTVCASGLECKAGECQ